MKVTITANCFVDGEPKKVGDEVETNQANLLVGMGKAEIYVEKKPEPKAEVKQEKTRGKK